MALISIDDIINQGGQQQSSPTGQDSQSQQQPTQQQSPMLSQPFIWNGRTMIPNPYAKNQTNQAGDIQGQVAQQKALIPGEAEKAAAVKQAELEPNKEGTIDTQRAQAIANLPSALRDIDVMKEQFNNAFPSPNGTSPFYQRIKGVMADIGAKTGIGTTPEQTAVLKAMPVATIGLVRMAGALGRVTNLELQKAEQATTQQGLTEAERFELGRTLSTQYLSRLDAGDWKVLLKQSPDLPYVIKDLGINSKIISRALNEANPTKHFDINGQGYDIPLDKVDYFKTKMGIK